METTSSSMAEPCARAGAPTWCCVRTHLKHEHIAAAHLRRLPAVEVFNPQLRLLRVTRRGPRWSTESLFPNYVFVRFPLESMLERVAYSPGVRSLMRFGDRVPEIPDAVIASLRRGLADLDGRVLTDAPLEGDEIEIAAGPFAGMRGRVTRVLPHKQRTRVLLDLMGRSVPAELSLDLVLFDRREAVAFALGPTPANVGWGVGLPSPA